MKLKALIPVILVCLIAGFFIGLEFQKTQEPFGGGLRDLIGRNAGQPESVDFSLFWDAWNLINEKYVDRSNLDTQEMVFGAIRGMVESVGDPFTLFLEAKESKRLEEDIRGEFAGVGIEIGIREDILTVIAPLKDTPADRAGIIAGDRILKIDGDSTAGVNLEEAVSKIRGRRGTKVVLTVSRKKDGREETKDFELIRDKIKIPTVKWSKIEPDIGHIQLFSFNQIAKNEFDEALEELKKQGADKKLILDLRNNPGGLLDLAIDISSYFLEPGELVVIEDFGGGSAEQGGNQKEELKSKPNGFLKDAKIVILINKGSASASEIVAGALHDNKGVKLIGEKTFGKGSVQQIEELRFKTSLKITVAKWLTPKGRSISDEGIEPDIKVEIPQEIIDSKEFELGVQGKDPQLEKAIEVIRGL
ncbi:MAG: S41 family peptidase [Parcubacteria group bacterium]|nr:S41 family peptidase [Parcubacteria group bacterium]